jgi:hypothetical protein
MSNEQTVSERTSDSQRGEKPTHDRINDTRIRQRRQVAQLIALSRRDLAKHTPHNLIRAQKKTPVSSHLRSLQEKGRRTLPDLVLGKSPTRITLLGAANGPMVFLT